jgi:hypothetical protein
MIKSDGSLLFAKRLIIGNCASFLSKLVKGLNSLHSKRPWPERKNTVLREIVLAVEVETGSLR